MEESKIEAELLKGQKMTHSRTAEGSENDAKAESLLDQKNTGTDMKFIEYVSPFY